MIFASNHLSFIDSIAIPVAAPRLRRLQQRIEYSAGDQGLGIGPEPTADALWFGPPLHLPSRVYIRSPFRAGADVQVA